MNLKIPEDLKPAALDNLCSLVESTVLPRAHFGNRSHPAPLFVPVSDTINGITLQIGQEYPLHLEQVEIILQDSTHIPAKAVTVSSSSVYRDDAKYAPDNTLSAGKAFFHSKKEKTPWLKFQFSKPTRVNHLVIHNANPGYFWRSYSLKVLTTDSHQLIYDNFAWCDSIERMILASLNYGAIQQSDAERRLAALYAKFYALDKLNALVAQQTHQASRIAIVDQANQALSQWGHGYTHHGINRTFRSFSATEKRNTVEALNKLMTQLRQQLGLATFITSGTLLGFVRDSELLAHDDDLDICYVSHERDSAGILAERSRLIAALNRMGYKAKLSASKTHIQARLLNGRVNLDLFVAFEANGCIDASPLPRGSMPIDQIHPLGQVSAYGMVLPAPRNIDLYLSNNYGPGWRQRDPSWRFDWAKARREYAFLLG